ncbi:raffinose/stachyose/melibiose transport system permease protein [Saccharothrix ecbatanensis]|uniref:Raffinose/stachyose/melibiose transport system permease protein n=1 Tax=Saccharothrix ecbatanensis TaxID=1105145 RepID=A0A7W9HJC8_9PSEU|nr:carbohydrate ABC transporter permease [Saccharothrix ecbatanensis]MBB5803377.1 raffinose/stachyose/melibiose transport system permease protein [Saccharothrix ecbatanensis]
MTTVHSGTRRRSLARHGFLTGVTVLLSLPMYILLINAFKSEADIITDPLGFTASRLTFDNLAAAFTSESFDVAGGYLNSLWITVGTVGGCVLMGGMCSYVLARAGGKKAVIGYTVLVCGLLVPTQTMLIPLVYLMYTVGLLGSPVGVILFEIAARLPFTVLVYTGFIRAIPRELDEAASIDGASRMGTYWRIIFPLLLPATASIAIFVGIGTWNDYLNPSVILGPGDEQTITTGLYAAIGPTTTSFEQVFAFLWIASIPTLLFYAFMQRYFVSGLSDGALKG